MLIILAGEIKRLYPYELNFLFLAKDSFFLLFRFKFGLSVFL